MRDADTIIWYLLRAHTWWAVGGQMHFEILVADIRRA